MKEKNRFGNLRKNKYFKLLIIVLLGVPLIFGFTTQMPEGTSYESSLASVSEVNFLYDLTYMKDEVLVHKQNILNEEISLIQEAEEFIVTDLFLFNPFYNTEESKYPESTARLTNVIIEQKKKKPHLKIYFITDEINSFYGAFENEQFKKLKENGITVIETKLNELRDPNPLYAGYWKVYAKPFGVKGDGWISNPFGTNAPKVNVRNTLKLLNFKANHRKVVITDKGAIVGSANPHDASSYHSNSAFRFNGEIVKELLETEKAVARLSGYEIDAEYSALPTENRKNTEVKILTENKILQQVINEIKATEADDTIRMGMFYLSHRQIIKELKNAAARNVQIQIVLDPNKDAFGLRKNGIPNRQVAQELIEEDHSNLKIRWYDTHGEQYHSKIIVIQKNGKMTLITGSANFTRRNLDDYNLETDIMVRVSEDDNIALEFIDYFNRIWNNEQGSYTVAFEKYKDNSLVKKIIYRFQEATGLCTY